MRSLPYPTDASIRKFIKRLIKALDRFSSTKALAIISILVVVCGGGYAATQATLSQASTADEFNSTYLSADAASNGGSIIVLAQHTNMFKLLILMLQGLLPYNIFSWVLLNALFVISTIILWSFLLKKVAKDIRVFSISNLLLTSILMASTELSIALSMTTQRHLDYVLLLFFLYLVFEFRLKTMRSFIGASVVLTILVASDYFFLTLVPATVIAIAILEALASKKIIPFKELFRLILASMLGVVGGVSLIKALVSVGVFNLFGSVSKLNVIGTLTPSLESIWTQVLVLTSQIAKLLGANVFGVPFSKSLLLIAPFILFAGMAVVFIWRALVSRQPGRTSLSAVLSVFLILTYLAYVVNSLAHPSDAYIRFVSITPFIFVAVVVLSSYTKRNSGLLLLLTLALLVSGGLRLIPNHSVYVSKQTGSQRWVHTNNQVIDALKNKGIKIAYSTIGWSATSWFYSDKQINVYNMLPCNMRGAALSNTSWYQDHDTPTAIIRDNSFPSYAIGETWHTCDNKQMDKIYGKPKETVVIIDAEKKIDLLFYDYDVNTKFVDYKHTPYRL